VRAAEGEVVTRSEPRWVKVPVTVVVMPDMIVTRLSYGSVYLCTWLKGTVYDPGANSRPVRPHESAICELPTGGVITIWDGAVAGRDLLDSEAGLVGLDGHLGGELHPREPEVQL
jgi:hypothetical protein